MLAVPECVHRGDGGRRYTFSFAPAQLNRGQWVSLCLSSLDLIQRPLQSVERLPLTYAAFGSCPLIARFWGDVIVRYSRNGAQKEYIEGLDPLYVGWQPEAGTKRNTGLPPLCALSAHLTIGNVVWLKS